MTDNELKPEAPELLPCGCKITPDDAMKSSVYWNPYNKVVQCHQCGQVYESRASSPQGELIAPKSTAPAIPTQPTLSEAVRIVEEYLDQLVAEDADFAFIASAKEILKRLKAEEK